MHSSKKTSLHSLITALFIAAVVASVVGLGALTLAREYRVSTEDQGAIPHTNTSANSYVPVRGVRPSATEDLKRKVEMRKQEVLREQRRKAEARKNEAVKARTAVTNVTRKAKRVELQRKPKQMEKKAPATN